jgi:hypothetical protein
MVSCQECPGGGQRVKIVLSFGLVALALFSALCVVVGQRVAPRIEQSLGIDQPVERSFSPGGVSYDELRNAPLNSVPVNESAAREIKRQDVYCPPCDQMKAPGFTRNPVYLLPFAQAGASPSQPAKNQVTVTSTPWANKYSLAVFVGTDQASQRLLDWVNRDPQLSDLRKNVHQGQSAVSRTVRWRCTHRPISGGRFHRCPWRTCLRCGILVAPLVCVRPVCSPQRINADSTASYSTSSRP